MTSKVTTTVAAMGFAAMTVMGSANAEDARYYGGLSIGQSRISESGSVGGIRVTLDDEDLAYQGQFGVVFGNGMDIALEATDFGEHEATVCAGRTCVSGDIEIYSLGLALSSLLELDNGLRIVPKLGVHLWRLEAGDSRSSRTTDPYYGLGVNYPVAEDMDFFGGVNLYKLGDADIGYLHLGLRSYF